MIRYNTDTNKFEAYENSAWSNMIGAGGSSQWTTLGSNIYYNTGNVGIGTTNPAYLIDAQKNLNGDVQASIANYNSGGAASATLSTQTDAGTAAFKMFSTAQGGASQLYGNGTSFEFVSAKASGYMVFKTGGANERMRITSSGNVGIGTTNPNANLMVDVNQNTYTRVRARNGNSGSAAGVGYYFGSDADNDYAGYIVQNSSTNTTNFAGANSLNMVNSVGAISFQTGLSGAMNERMRITASGSIGIGTTAPAVALDVNGGVRAGSSAVVSTCGSGQSNGEGTQRYNYTSHSMEYCNGSSWVALSSGASVPTLHQTLLTTGSSWTSPADITASTQFRITLIGGGGGGGGAKAANGYGAAGGGAGGNIIWIVSGLSANTAYSYTIGAAGTAGTTGGSAGGAGGSTSMTIAGTTATAGGGSGGGGQSSGSNTAGGAGGTVINGTIQIAGQAGGDGGGYGSGAGGSSLLGFGGPGFNWTSSYLNKAGVSGTGYGAGGSGAAGDSSAKTGGGGSQGCIVIEAIY
jgi:hypothetical protein